MNLTDPDGRCPQCAVAFLKGAAIGMSVELVTQVLSNALTGKDLLEIDYYDIGQSGITGGLTGGVSALNATAKVTKLAATTLLVTDELAKAGTDVTYGEDGLEVNSVANGSKSATDAGIEAVIGVGTSKLAEGLGELGGTLMNRTQGLPGQQKAAAKRVRGATSNSPREALEKSKKNVIDRQMGSNTRFATETSGVLLEPGKVTAEEWAKSNW